ncbi:bifunctional diguanylate cyclase/phosphodiesterase [Rhizobium sp. L1K21]|uniref:putative bifunctional diguanylate cyclase/phosphodiesterase n=1 Tax=Rhizobium sp. L1K21 TaxID=2954933 RepID=UPI002093ECE4|nr:bifunctional diguanylate cyclase/phosphodiesterase [Rhizobium sp. L1K21]MCO6185625.1 bifunctional diguanylate cyclase/phosphodiesterase [Rhizobium sp. L1K21]
MMLSVFLSDIKRRYAIAGSAAGALLPLSFYSLDLAKGGNLDFLSWALSSPSQFTLAAMPVWSGLVALQFGRGRTLRMAAEKARREEEKRLRYAATHDALTGLGNRAALEDDGKRLLKGGASPALLLLDLDRFKLVNDTLGHDVGDALLVEIASQFLRLKTRGVRVYRLGGDEFVFLISRVSGNDDVEDLCSQIKAMFAAPFILEAGPVRSGVSIGVSYATPQTSFSTVLKSADLALYKAKEIAGSAHVFYEPEMAEEALKRARLERELVQAIETNQIYLEFQPIVGVETRAVRSFEALARWRHPTDGCLMPKDFIEVAERTGLIIPLGLRILQLACREAVKWPSPLGVSVNISGVQFKDPQFPEMVQECLQYYNLAPGRLTLEIAESVFALELDEIKACLEELRMIGVRIVLDDFGAGFSSVNNMRRFQLDQLKLDRSFAAAMLSDDAGSSELMDVMMRFGATMKVSTAIEGIEDERQMEFVSIRGACEVQGYLFSRPISANKVGELIARSVGEGDIAAA